MTLDGMDALKRAVTRAPGALRAHAGTAIASSAFAVAQRMKSLAPMASGELRRAIASSSSGLSGRVTIGSSAPYWPFVEFGTVKMSARPFIRPAAEIETSDFIRRMRAVGPKLERDWSSGRFV